MPSEIIQKIKSIPPIAWVIAGVIILAVFVLGRGGSSSQSRGIVTAPGGGGGGGGSGEVISDTGQQIADLSQEIRTLRADTLALHAEQQSALADAAPKQGLADLLSSFQQQNADLNSWKATIEAELAQGAPTSPGGTNVGALETFIQLINKRDIASQQYARAQTDWNYYFERLRECTTSACRNEQQSHINRLTGERQQLLTSINTLNQQISNLSGEPAPAPLPN